MADIKEVCNMYNKFIQKIRKVYFDFELNFC